MPQYIDIGLNLFCRQFRDPERVIADASAAGVACILTGSDMKDNEKVHAFTQQHPEVKGTCGIHPHNADSAKEKDWVSLMLYTTSFRGGITTKPGTSSNNECCTPPHFEGESQHP